VKVALSIVLVLLVKYGSVYSNSGRLTAIEISEFPDECCITGITSVVICCKIEHHNYVLN